MVSSLAAQLAQHASLNTALLVDKSRRKSGESYLFTGREADQHDLESVHALGINGLLQLASLSPLLRPFEDSLFSDAAKATDRTLQPAEANAELDKHLAAFLRLLGPFLLEAPTGKIIEWLVRRFRINEFNVPDVLALFLPYHESPHFAKMVTILHIQPNSTWSFLLAYKSAAQSVPRVALVTEMLKNADVARFVVSLLPSSIHGSFSHRTLLAFNAATSHDFITRSKSLDEGTVAYLLPALLEPLQPNTLNPPQKDAILGSYILLSALSQKCHLAPAAVKAIMGSMASCARRVTTKQFLSAVVSVCEAQDESEGFSDATVKAVLRLSNIQDKLRDASAWVGIEKFICPLLSGLTKRLNEETTSSFIESIVAAPRIPSIVVHRITSSLIQYAIAPTNTNGPSSAPEIPAARRLLSNIQQRHPVVLQQATEDIVSAEPSAKDGVEQLVISLSLVSIAAPSSKSGNTDAIFSSTSADANVRKVAVADMINTLVSIDSGTDISLQQSIEAALFARVQDTNTEVLDTLYSNSNIILPILQKHTSAYLSYLSNSLNAPGSRPKKLFLRAHLTFLSAHFCRAIDLGVLGQVFTKVFFPLLLFSKPKQRTAEIVWEVIAQGHGVSAHELLNGCVDIWSIEKSKSVTDSVDKMTAMNLAISAKMAENILISNNYPDHLRFLLAALQDPNPHARALGYLIARSLLGRLSGEHQIDAAYEVLQVMRLQELSGVEGLLQRSVDDVDDLFSDHALGKHVVLKPSSNNTTHWLQTSIVALIPHIPRPAGVDLNWFGDSIPTSTDTRGSRYVGLLRSVYRLANSSASHPSLTTNLLRSLFVGLRDDIFAFLAGVWTSPKSNEGASDVDNQYRVIALSHAAAYLEANILQEEGTAVDFQTILPSLVVALGTLDAQGRRAALACIVLMLALTSKKFVVVYAMDTIYSSDSDKLQFLDRDDLKKYLEALVEHQDHLINDASYLQVLHQEHLGKRSTDKKKDTEYKNRVLCYILSHISALSLPHAQVALLKTIEDVSTKTKVQILLPAIQDIIQSPHVILSEEYATLVMASFDISAVGDLNDANSASWPVFLSALRYYFKSGSMVSPRLVLARALEHGLFAGLTLPKKIEVCEVLLATGAPDIDAYPYCKKVLSNIIQDVPLIVHLLGLLQPKITDGTPRAKKTKLANAPEDDLPALSLFVEVIGTKPLPGSLDLISRLLETLNRVVQSASSTSADMSYIEQLLMSAVENAAEKVLEAPNLSPSAIRLDILVELIRVANNPQTFHQALLLMASLARLAPDSVLHNVMPVFTFMGSNVFHRDDTYSFRVVQKTIDSIVPVMVASLKRAHSNRLDLYIGSRDFLRVFTDAANHIPRHRRTNFFSHLVDVLGPDDFLAPVCMLLVEKASNRVIRQNVDEVKSAIALPISILHHYSATVQIFTLSEILRESKRLATRIAGSEPRQPTFLEISPEEDHSQSLAVLKRRAQALVTFVGHALKLSPTSSPTGPIPEGGEMSDLVALLIDLSTIHGGASTDGKVDDISKAARSSMVRALGVMSVSDFISAVLSMLESGEPRVQAGALDLLSERLPNVSDKARQEITPTVNKIIITIKTVIALHPEGPLAISAFKALKSIGLTISKGEESALTSLIPTILTAIRDRKMTSWAMLVLAPLAAKLGPRIIPYFREIVAETVAVLRDSIEDTALSVLHGLLTSIPTFWGSSELKQVIGLYVDNCAASNTNFLTMSSLMKAIAKRAQTKVLLPTLCDMWPSIEPSSQTTNLSRFVGYFDLVKRSLRSASRPDVLENLRPLFKVCLEAFDVAEIESNESAEAEAAVISAFLELVIKLNEAAFRPLFRRLYDWAFADDTVANTKRATFCHVYIALLDFFKGLMNPYMSFLLKPFVDVLTTYSQLSSDDGELWTCIIRTLTQSFSFDDGAFWRDDKLRQIASPLIAQVPVCTRLATLDGRTILPECLSALAECVTDDALLKSINLDVLMHTRSEDAKTRLFALTCSTSLWQAHGGKLLGLVSDTTTFMAECAEDENDSVVKEAHRLKDAVESVAGNIDGI